MKSRPLGLMAIALVGLAVVGPATPAHATLSVFYTTHGTFSGGTTPGTGVYTDAANGVKISFEDIVLQQVDVNPPPASGLSFGNFNSTGTTASSTAFPAVSSGFTIDIFQAVPSPTTPPQLTLIGTLQGNLSSTSTGAFVQFTNFTPTETTVVSYYITEADNGTLGKANIVQPTVNNGISSVEGAITAGVMPTVPEPSTIVMGVMAIVPLGLVMYRRRAKSNVAG